MKWLILFPLFLFSQDLSNACLNEKIDRISEQNIFCGWQGKSGSATIDGGFVFKSSYLYGQAKEGGLDYTQVLDFSGTFADGFVVGGELFEPTSKWENGFQAGIGYILSSKSQWDLLLNWTYFHSKAKDSLVSEDPTLQAQALKPTWLPFLMGSAAFEGSVNWVLNFNTLDFMIGRDFFISRWLSFHPQAGVRAGWINQHYHANYLGAAGGTGGLALPLGPTEFIAKWKYHGAGIRLGTDAEWHLNSHFSFVANGFASILYGKTNLKELFDGTLAIAISPGMVVMAPESLDFKKHYFCLRTALETELGIRLQSFFGKYQNRRVIIGGYYGFSYWFNQNAMINQFSFLDLDSGSNFITNLPIAGDLQLQGLRAELEIEF